MPVQVVEIFSKKDKKKFFKFYHQLYAGNPYFAPPLYAEDMDEFDPKSNTNYNQYSCRMFLAYKNEQIVGRVAGLIHTDVNNKNNTKQLRFTRFDVIDDIEVTKALFSKLTQWAQKDGLTEIIGPMSFSDLGEEGMLIEGFDQQSMYADTYNHEYYINHMQELGAYKVVDWHCYRITVPKEVDTRMENLAHMLMKKHGYTILDIAHTPKKALKKCIWDTLTVLDEAFEDIYGSCVMNDYLKQSWTDKILTIMNADFATIVLQEGKPIGYGLLIPSLNEVLRKAKGSLLKGALPMLRTIKRPGNVADMMSIGVLDSHLKKGVPAIIMYNSLKGLHKHGIQYIETGRELEDNHNVQNLWKNQEKVLNRRFRCWGIAVPSPEQQICN